MCDYMYYEYKQRAKAKNLQPEEPELEKVAEEKPIVVKA
jgi:hypothetical protein